MDFKKLFMNNKAVSPVIGVILMVAITVILAAAIGSSVFGQGTAQPAPQANLNIEADGITDGLATIKIEHLGGDPINFSKSKVVASVNGGNSQTVAADLGTISIGDIKKLALRNAESTADPKAPIVDNSVNPADAVAYGDIINIKVIDEATNQLICDRDIRF
ncbi:flagellin N-terminal-like domain-containing protein [Methanosarcina thermophila]|jgi:flagellin-like protein|uniref:Flagellin N-terminal-like domain-containing protein n=2 Tax=Methanosarcina thermophila TaxID=2210 RepID=A0A1I6YNH5_METTE|nr:type IV pilin [Methanosarcina thermophila]ALK05183.1 MAG: hypothetical protein AAY43_05030 [Methanosarcina sp. 795]AKB13940.1 hypothetical protein MSTHT_2182 [Methanosarcina thermophila TM-1]NLU56003.1 type IV pilin [Methanosarcina thermophila]SFT52023.1 flagellin N-terminal-like domain-containing protein [Methanosarcina thermophila]BAW28984.1 conserved hypothetical protein [Methanosarcina thermophila]